MIQKKQYKDWSAAFHAHHVRNPIVIQMELTYRCPLHCLHCYTQCYNGQTYAKSELSTAKVKKLMDKLQAAGCLWFTFTGGDPLVREDFIELYDYAKDKGFIVSVMTSLVSLNSRILKKMIAKPPFCIEMTFNGATVRTYEKISQVKGSFAKVKRNIDAVLKAKLPLKIKTLLSRNNIHERRAIQSFVESKGLRFCPSTLIFARLNSDSSPCALRLAVDDIVQSEMITEYFGDDALARVAPATDTALPPRRLFNCALGNWQWHIDPSGRLNLCSCLREPSYDIVEGDVTEGVRFLSEYVRKRRFCSDSECKHCGLRPMCPSCPGKAKLEIADEEEPVPYFCRLTKKYAERLSCSAGAKKALS